MAAPSVSVMIPTYNSLAYLQEAVASVLAQTMTSWELIVVDDGSTDGTAEWLRRLQDDRIRFVLAPHTGNLSHVRNLGLSAARARWLAFLDADDRWLPSKLERQLALHAERPSVRWSYTGRTLVDARGQPLAGTFPWKPVEGWILRELLTHEAAVASPSMMVEQSLMEEVGGFDEQFPYAGDYDLRLRLAIRAECGVVDEPLLEIRRHDACRTRRQPDASHAMAGVYRKFDRNAPSREARSIARRQEVYFRLKEARLRLEARQWSSGWRALAKAARVRPLDLRVHRLAARSLLLLSRSFTTR